MAELAIAPAAVERWRRLAPGTRAYLREFLGVTPTGEGRPHVVQTLDLPPRFADDLAAGGPELRSAFPQLQRTVVAVRGLQPLTVAIVCEGDNAGAFFDLMLPTGRHVVFDEIHRLRLGGEGEIVEDRLGVDVRSILRQLADATKPAALNDATPDASAEACASRSV